MEEKGSYQGKATLVIKTLGNTTKEEVDIGGSSALDILSRSHDVEVLKTWASRRLDCIDGVCAENGFWWRFYVNDEIILSSVDKYYPKEGDTITLEYGGGK